MNTLSIRNNLGQDVNIAERVSRAITRLADQWKKTSHYLLRPRQHRTYIEQHLTDPNIGPEIARSLR